ncbi:ABC transporter transmembrane domain-containing protein [Bacillus pacificus]
MIKAYVRQKYEINQFGNVNTNLTKINIRAVQLISLMMPIIMLVVSGGIVATLWVGGEKVFNGTLQVGAILAFVNYLNIIFNVTYVYKYGIYANRASISVSGSCTASFKY